MQERKTISQQIEDMDNTGAHDLVWFLINVSNLPIEKARAIIAHLSKRAEIYGMRLIDGYFHFGSQPTMAAKDHHALESFLLEEDHFRRKWDAK